MPDLCPDCIDVTTLGVDKEFQLLDPMHVNSTLTRLKLPQRYILYVGTLEPRKNLPSLVKSYRQLVEAGEIAEDLVIVGKQGWGYEALLKQIDVPALRGRVHLTGYLDQQDLPAVYAGARLFVYPSLFEGFGFPPLEAMACGVPTISTQTSSLMENLEGAAELVPPGNIGALAQAMIRLLTDDALWTKRREQGLELASRYRWERTASDTLMSYQAAMTTDRQRPDY